MDKWSPEPNTRLLLWFSHEPTLQFMQSICFQVMSNSLQPHGVEHARLPCPSLSPRVYSNSCPLSQWCHPILSSYHSLLLSPLIFSGSGSFLMSWLFASGGQSIIASASASVLPVNVQAWFPLGWTCLIPLLSKGLSRVFPNTTVQKHQFFCAQLSF